MSIKNIKGLSLFLILMVLMIGAIGAVSAATTESAGTSTADVTDDTAKIVQSANTDPIATGTVTGTIVTNTTSAGVTGKTVPVNTPVIAKSGDSNSKLTLDGKIYDAEGTDTTVAYTNAAGVTWGADGTYSAEISIATGQDLTKLDPSETYYLKLSLESDGVAEYAWSDSIIYSSEIAATDFMIPVTYTELFSLSVKDYNLTYGDSVNYTGTLVDKDGKAVQNADVSVEFDKAGVKTTATVKTDSNGVFVVNDKVLEDTTPGSAPLAAGTYTVTATYNSNGKDFTGKSTVKVAQMNVTINAVISEDTVEFGDWATITVSPVTASGEELDFDTLDTLSLPISYTATPKSTGVDETPVELNAFSGNNVVTDATGSYLVTVSGKNTGNYNFISESFNYTVKKATLKNATISFSEDPITVPKGGAETVTITVDETDEEGDENVAADSDLTVKLYNSNGVYVKDLAVTSGAISVVAADVANGYYITIDFTKTGYEDASKTVSIILKTGTVLTVTPDEPEYAYGGNVNITISLKDTDGKVLNATVSIMDDNETVTTIDVVNGSAVYSLDTLNLDAGVYKYTVVYGGDDTYKDAEADLTITVVADSTLGYLSVNTTKVNYNINSDEVIGLNLTQFNNHSAIMPYNGVISYTYADSEGNDQTVNFTMTDGIATIAVADLEGLSSAAPVAYKFQILGNNQSNQVTVTVTTKKLNGAIITENVTTTNNTIIVISGTITNATDGKALISIIDADNEPISAAYANVNEDGAFSASFAPLATGNYTASIVYEEGDIGANVNPGTILSPVVINVTVSGESPEPEPTPTNVSYPTVLVIDEFSEVVDAGKSLVGRLTLEDGTPVVGMHIELTLTRVSNGASRTYSTTTDYNGEFQFPINLAVGEYTAKAVFNGVTIDRTNVTYEASESPVTPFSVLADNKTEPTDVNDTTVVITTADYTGVYGENGNLIATFTVNDTAIVGLPAGSIDITLTRVSNGQSKTYSWFTTDFNGAIQLPIELGAGEYTAHIVFKTTDIPEAMQERFNLPPVVYGAEADAKITVTNS